MPAPIAPANSQSEGRQGFTPVPPPPDYLDVVHTLREPLAIEQKPDPETLNASRPPGRPRAMFNPIAWFQDKAWGHWSFHSFTGGHAVITRAPNMHDGVQAAWDQPRRTYRSAPTGLWDDGTGIGRPDYGEE